jgi:hypothetical protein
VGNTSLIKETTGKRTSVIDSTHCIHEELPAQEILMSTLLGNMTEYIPYDVKIRWELYLRRRPMYGVFINIYLSVKIVKNIFTDDRHNRFLENPFYFIIH